MNYENYHNCLRLQITNDELQDERIEDLVAHCLTYGFDNVMLMMNVEEFNIGHLTVDDAKPLVALLKKAKTKLEEKGISVSLNHWMELGHADRGRPLKAGQNFVTLVDMDGVESIGQACPLCKEWRKQFSNLVSYLVSELKPDTFWIEDDFRLHNHAPLNGIGCYCAEHMKYYNAKLGANYTREEFLSRVLKKGGCNEERKVWLDANRDVMLDLADHIAGVVKAANSTTDVAIMSSSQSRHCLEARDWDKFLENIGKGGNKINRIHLPYGELSGREHAYYVNTVSMAVRAMSGDDVIVMPETELGAASHFMRSPRYFRFSLECAIPLVLSGMTYSIYDFVGNGVRETLGYGQEVKALTPYMQAIKSLGLKFSSLTGVVIPVDPRAAYYKTLETDYWDLAPREYHVAGYLSGLGVAYKYSREKEFLGQTVFMSGSSMDYFTDEQLKKVFLQNYVIVDGSGALRLKERGLLSLICAKDARYVPAGSGYQEYEEIVDSERTVCGVKRLRASCRSMKGGFVEVEYGGQVCVETKIYNRHMQPLAAGFVRGKGFAVTPFQITEKMNAYFCDLRRAFVCETVGANTKEYVVCDKTGVSPYLYKREKGYALVLINGNVDGYNEIAFETGVDFCRISAVQKDGAVSPVQYERNGNFVTVKTPMEYLSSVTLLLE